jgi:acyl dehydratase
MHDGPVPERIRMLDYDKLMALSAADVPRSYSDRDSLLYALGIGFGADPLDEKELPYVVETMGRCTVPTMATTLSSVSFLANCGWNYAQVLHGEQKLELYRPLPMAAELLTTTRVASVLDRGAGRGAVITVATEGRLERDDTALFTLESTLIARGDGGFGGPTGSVPTPHILPEREPDLVCDLPIRADQGLLYRLCGDRNPLHADPSVARAAGFDAPILHGLCTYGIACRAILATICDYDFTLINGFQARFSAPVYPGDVLTTDMWQERNVISFRCHVKSRKSVVLNNGKCLLAM